VDQDVYNNLWYHYFNMKVLLWSLCQGKKELEKLNPASKCFRMEMCYVTSNMGHRPKPIIWSHLATKGPKNCKPRIKAHWSLCVCTRSLYYRCVTISVKEKYKGYIFHYSSFALMYFACLFYVWIRFFILLQLVYHV
jgi:hypothetical protein